MPPLRLPPRFFRHSVRHIASEYPGSAWLFRSLRRASPLSQGPDVVKPVHPSRHLVPRTRTGLPCSQGTPMCLCPALRPRRTSAPSLHGASVLPPPRGQRRLRQQSISRLNHTASALAVYASCRHPWRRRKTRFRGWPTFPGGILIPTEFRWRVLGLATRPSPWACHGAITLHAPPAYR